MKATQLNTVGGGLKLLGARILLSPDDWPPAGEMGPNGYWEARTVETGLPLIVNNRTGKEPDLDSSSGESTLVAAGSSLKRQYEQSPAGNSADEFGRFEGQRIEAVYQ
jgi:hypothetical protein